MQKINVNGLTLLYANRPSELSNFRIIVNAGSSDEEKDSYGVAHYLEHLVFKGTKNLNYQQLNRKFSLLGSVNAYTSNDKTVFYLTFRSKTFQEAIQLLSEIVFYPSLPADEFEIERGTILAERQMGIDNPNIYFYNQLRENMFGEIGHSIIGTEKSLKSMKIDHIHRFRDKNYLNENIVLAYTGSASLAEVIDAINKSVPQLTAGKQTPRKIKLNLNHFHCHHSSKQAKLQLVSKGILFAETRLIDDVFNNGFGSGMHSLLSNRIREELGLCYSIYSHHTTGLPGSEQESIGVALDEEKIDVALHEINKIIDQVKKEGFNDELLEVAKANELFRIGKGMETSEDYNHLADAYFTIGDYPIEKYTSYEETEKQVLAITNNDIIEFANRVFGNKIKIATMTQG